jgi:hypothetical protein
VFVVGEWRLSLANADQHIQVNMRIHSEVLEVLHAEDRHGASFFQIFVSKTQKTADRDVPDAIAIFILYVSNLLYRCISYFFFDKIEPQYRAHCWKTYTCFCTHLECASLNVYQRRMKHMFCVIHIPRKAYRLRGS